MKGSVKYMYRKNTECFFCKEIEDPTRNFLNRSRVVLETKNFVVFPTEGCFKIGYLLIMPKQHFLCFGELESDYIVELEEIIKQITQYVKKKQNLSCIIFEHGTRDLSKLTSTSIMHAHIHLIPFEEDIISYLPTYCELRKIGGFSDLKKENKNYLFLRDIHNNNYIVKNEDYPSQFFRRISCKALNIPKYWDWKKYRFSENVEITLDYYENLK